MKRCPITYEPIEETTESTYSLAGLHLLSPRLKSLADLEWSAEEQRREGRARAAKLSIQGVQPKLSAKLEVTRGRFGIRDRLGTYILKPQTDSYEHLPENEDLTMRLAAEAGITTPLHGLVRSRDGSWTYFIKRFDRRGRGKKLATEDFAQLAGERRGTKYDFSMEKVVGLIDRFCTFPMLERRELLLRTLFCFLTGNEDMHLKNFSVITKNDVVKLTPAYDMLNTTIALHGATEELALPLRGKKAKLSRDDFVEYLGRERLGLDPKVIETVMESLRAALPRWDSLIKASFLPTPLKDAYAEVVARRTARIWP